MSKRWNYLTIEIKPSFVGGLRAEDIQAELDKQGRLGWELVNIIVPAPLVPVILVMKKEG